MAAEDTKINVVGTLVSVPYVKMTVAMMRQFGAEVELVGTDEQEITQIMIKAKPYDIGDSPTEFVYEIESDASAASYAFAAAAVTGIPVTVPIGVEFASCLQGDITFVDILEKIGCEVIKDDANKAITVSGPSQSGQSLKGVEVDMFHISDTVMTLAAMGPLCTSSLTIKNVANIRIKETDRLIATVTELKRLGQEVEYGDDWFKINPTPVIPVSSLT